MAEAKGIRMGGGYVSLGVDRGPLDKGLEAAKSSFQTWGKGIAALGAAIAAAGVAVASPFLAGLSDFMTWGSEMRTTMRMTNMGFAETQLAMNGMRLSAEELPVAIAKMDEFMVSAADGGADANQALRDMGLTLGELNGMTRSERLMAFADGLNRVGDEALRTARIRDVFGRGGMAMNIEGGAAGIRTRADRAAGLAGDSRGEEAFRAAAALGRAKSEMGAAMSAIGQSLAFAAAPVMTEFFQLVTKIAIAVREWTDANRPLLTMIFTIAEKVFLAGSVIGFLGSAIYAASFAFTFLQGAIAIVGGSIGFVGGLIAGGFNVALGVMNFMLGLASGGFGSLTVASAIWGVGNSTWMAIVTGATWLYNTAMAAVVIAYGAYSAAAAFASTVTVGYAASLAAAWVWEVLTTGGAWLLTAAIAALTFALGVVVIAAGAFVAVLGGFALATAGLIALSYVIQSLEIEFSELHESLAFLDGIHDLAETVTEAFYDLWDAIANSAIGSFFGTIRDAIVWLWDTAVGAFDYLYDAIAEIVASPLAQWAIKVAVGCAAIMVAIVAISGYLAYISSIAAFDLLSLSAEGFATMLTEVGDLISVYAEGFAIMFEPLIDLVKMSMEGFAAMFAMAFDAISMAIEGVLIVFSPLIRTLGMAVDYVATVYDEIAFIGGTVLSALSGVGTGLSAVFSRMVSGIGTAFGFVTVAAGEIFSSIGSAFTASFGVISQFFTKIVDAAMVSFAGIKAAFNAGEWELIWGILQTTALLAWEHLSFMGLSVFYVWKDTMIDAFGSAWIAIKSMFITVWGEIKAMAFEGIAVMIRGLAAVTPAGAARDLLNSQAQGFDLDARLARNNAARDAANVGDGGPDLDEQMLRVNRDMALAAGNRAEVDRLNAELQDQVWYADFLRNAMPDPATMPGGGMPGGGPGGPNGPSLSSSGTFSRFAAMGFMGAFGGAAETNAEREARMARENLDEIRRLLARQRGVVMQ